MTRRRVATLVAAVAAALATMLAGVAVAGATPGPSGAPQYWFDTWQLPQLWAAGASGQGVTIAEIDTGVNAALPELAGNIVPGTDLGAGGNGEIDREVSAFGHGTAMASIMVAHPGLFGITGIAPDARLMPIAVPLRGTTDASSDDHLGAAIRYAAGHGAKIISMSLGGVRKPSSTDEPCPPEEQSAIYYALAKGAVLLAAAGNEGQSGSPVEEPGVCLGVIAVGAVDRAGAVAAFSSRHPYVTLAAPGVDIPSLSRVPDSAYSGDGTSQATAIASAVLAIVWSKYHTLSARQLVARVLATLDDHRTTPSSAYGYGVIDAYRAVTGSVAADAPDPVFSAVAPFLARYQAFGAAPAAQPRAVPAVAQPRGVPAAPQPLGRFAVGRAPRLPSVSARRGLWLAVAGLLALVVLGGLRDLAVTRRRAPPSAPSSPFAPFDN